MSKRKYDHLRFRKNEDKRLLATILKFPPTPSTEESPFGENSPEVTRALEQQEAREVPKLCTNGRCTLYWDPKRQQVNWSIGPAGCCDE